MLLTDRMDMAGRALDWLAQATHTPPRGNVLTRDNGHLDEGCGALNLVCVAEPLKIARLVAGVDDSSPGAVRIVPRLPASWTGYEATHWPILTPSGVVYANIRCAHAASGMQVDVRVEDGGEILNLAFVT